MFEIVKKLRHPCDDKTPFVLKTIRMHRPTALPWILNTDIKVIDDERSSPP